MRDALSLSKESGGPPAERTTVEQQTLRGLKRDYQRPPGTGRFTGEWTSAGVDSAMSTASWSSARVKGFRSPTVSKGVLPAGELSALPSARRTLQSHHRRVSLFLAL